MVSQTAEGNFKLARDRNLTDSILHQLQGNRPALLRLRLVLTVAKQVERDVKTLVSFIFATVMAAANQEFGGCGDFRNSSQELG